MATKSTRFSILLKYSKNSASSTLSVIVIGFPNESVEQILEFEIGTAIPRHYELDSDLKVLKAENL